MKKVLFYHYAPKLHSCYNSLFENGPRGYQFVGAKDSIKEVLHKNLNKGLWFSKMNTFLSNLIDTNALRDFLYRYKKFEEHDILFSTGHVCYRKEPWILDADMVTLLTGYDLKKLEKKKEKILKLLLSDKCKKIIPCTEKARETFELFFQSEDLNKKLETIYPTRLPNKNFKKNYDASDKIKLLYVGSANFPEIFLAKGGRETLLAYKKLSEKYGDRVELFMASEVPEEYQYLTEGLKNLTIDSEIRLNTGLDKVFETSDIFLQPSHYFALMAPLDAMSYELPIISTNVWAIPEYVMHEYNGLLVSGSQYIDYTNKYALPNYSKQFYKDMERVDEKMIDDIVEKTSFLIDYPEKRKAYGKNGRKELESGKFSIEVRNKKLKAVLDSIDY